MGGQPKPPKPPSGRTNLASCIVATIFLIFILIIIFIVYFTLFKPQSPKLSVTAVQLPSFYLSPNNSLVSFTFSQYVSVHNPNRAGFFSHYDSSIQLLYAGAQVGLLFVPAGKIAPGRTQYMAATFSVKSFPLGGGGGAAHQPEGNVGPTITDGLSGGMLVGPTLEIGLRMEMAGRVRVLHFFTHHVEAKAECSVSIAVSGGSVLGFHC